MPPLPFPLRRLCHVALCWLAILPVALAEEKTAPAQKTVRLFTIGNSFTQNATHYLGSLAAGEGQVLIHHIASIGGSTLQQHWDKAQQHEANPEDPSGFYSSKKSLKQELQAEPWDFVTIQQASIKSHNVETYRPYAAKLQAYIKQYAPTAELLLHETWAYRVDDKRFDSKSPAAGEPKTQAEMFQQLQSAYATIARELGLRRIPTGDAFYLADTDPVLGYQAIAKPDLTAFVRPALPEQPHSLHKGWSWSKGKTDGQWKLGMDGHHANTAGEYLGACCYYEVIFGQSVVGAKFVPPGMSREQAAYLQAKAHQAVAALGEKK